MLMAISKVLGESYQVVSTGEETSDWQLMEVVYRLMIPWWMVMIVRSAEEGMMNGIWSRQCIDVGSLQKTIGE